MGKPGVENPDVVRGRFGGGIPPRIVLGMVALYLVVGAVSRHWFWFVMGALYLATVIVAGLRRPTNVDETGISTWAWRWSVRHLDWSEVTEVVRTGYSDQVTSVRLSDGMVFRLVDIPADQAAKVARIGDKPLVAPPAPRYTPVVGVPRRLTEAETDRELQRRADRLAADRARLQGQLDRRVRP